MRGLQAGGKGHSRREFLRWAGAAGAVGLAARSRAAVTPGLPIQHVIIACQENRSFDHYFGYYANVGPYGVPPGYSQPDGNGGSVAPYHLTSTSGTFPKHQWTDIHSEWDNGKMDGFYTTNGIDALGYFDQQDLPFYYSLADHFTLCGNYFCSLLGGTYPNRLYLCSGTCGGNTTNNIPQGSLTYPMILDVLDAHGITFKNYNVGLLVEVEADNEMMLFSNWINDPRINRPASEYFSDLSNGTLPQVSFITCGLFNDEHPPFDVTRGQATQEVLIGALMKSSAWKSSAYLLAYDEGGGFFDHVPPPQFDAYGAGIRVPMLVVSPFAKRGHVEGTLFEHSSVLKFLERVFQLPTLASINHQFDSQTPGANNQAANGQPFGPPAPPRDGRTDIGDLMPCFNFALNADYYPQLPAVGGRREPGDLS
ncbi:MAG TPA: alkaline phosphatase family protein [Bryobacteraceae bacterium]|nr:alkaline phosphatase family protein [Bryobacteraceae bacterium]